jgi:hypothetical protein
MAAIGATETTVDEAGKLRRRFLAEDISAQKKLQKKQTIRRRPDQRKKRRTKASRTDGFEFSNSANLKTLLRKTVGIDRIK